MISNNTTSLTNEALQFRFHHDYIREKFIKKLKKDVKSPQVVENVMQIYDRFSGDQLFPFILSQQKISDCTLELTNAISFCKQQVEDVRAIIDEISENQGGDPHSPEIRIQLFKDEIFNEIKNQDAVTHIIEVFSKTDSITDFIEEIKNSIFFEKLHSESGKFAIETFSSLFPINCNTVIRDSEKILNNIKTQKMIKKFVQDYLFPYIANFKKPEPNHVPLLNKLKQDIPISEKRLIRIALKVYIQCGAEGLDTNDHVDCRKFVPGRASIQSQKLTNPHAPEYNTFMSLFSSIFVGDDYTPDKKQLEWYDKFNPNNTFKSFSRGFLILLQTLATAIELDFPSVNLSPEKLIKLAKKALEKVNFKRKIETQKYLNEFQLLEINK